MYQFLYTESNNEKASEFEAKSLLYLFSMRVDSKEIENFFIDCFNDVTGANEKVDKLWDVQSKGIKNLGPKEIGKHLITLFLNNISSIGFSFYIFVMPNIESLYLNDDTKKVFDINNFKKKYISKISQGLEEEYTRRTKNELTEIINDIQIFLNEVNFVIADQQKCDYIKSIFNNRKIADKSDDFFNKIFDEIKNKQTALKNISIKDKTISLPVEVLEFKKNLTRKSIEMLILNRLIGINIFSYGIPIWFDDILSKYDNNLKRDILQKCNSDICIVLFNNNNRQDFWNLFELIYTNIVQKPKDNVLDVYEKIMNKKELEKIKIDPLSIQYFISLIKEGVINENC